MKLGRIHSKYTGEAFEELKDECLAFLEICCNNRADMERLLISKEEVRKNSERTGIDVASVGRWNHTLNVGDVLDEDEMKNYLDLIDCAVYLGARTFVAGINRDQTVSLYKNYTVAIEFFKRLISHADGRIKIAVQNCDWNNFIVSRRNGM